MTIDHLGYAVKRIDRALEAFEKLGYVFGTVIDDADRNVKICFGEKDGYRVELVSPLDKKAPSPIDIYLRNVGPTLYHICYRSDNLDKEIDVLKTEGFRLVVSPAKAVAFEGRRVAFMSNLGIGLMEIVEM